MYRPLHISTDALDRSPRRQSLIIVLVAALHVALIYAIVSGLATRIVLSAPSILNAEILPPKQTAAPPPAMPVLTQPAIATVPAPARLIAPSRAPVASITVVQGPPRPVLPAPAISAAPPVPAIAPAAARAIEGTHTIPPYPDLARRLGEQGTVRLRIALDAAGRVSVVTVQRSSGSERLDAAAVAWVQAHWRYHPATQGGKPVAASVLADVVFDLKRAG